MNNKKQIIIGLLLIAVIVGAAYLIENITKTQSLNSAKVVKISEKGKTTAYISADILKQLMKQDIDEDELALGPPLKLAMDAAGISEYTKVEVKGENGGNIILDEKDIDDNLIIYLLNDGTMNLCRKNKSSDSIIKGISEINILN